MASPQQQTTIPTLHHLAHSQSHRCLWALEEVALANPSFTYKLITYPRSIDNAGLQKVCPIGKSPILTLETLDGSPPPTIQLDPGVLTESTLILPFINEAYGGRMFDVQSEEDRRRDAFFTMLGTSSLIMKVSFCLLFEEPAQTAPFPFNLPFKLMALPMTARFMGDLAAIFQVMEDALSEAKPWFSGNAMGIADLNMSFGMEVADQRGYFDRAKYPKLAEWCQRIWKREAYQRAIAKAGGEYDLVNFGIRRGWALVFDLIFGKGLSSEGTAQN